MMRIRILLLVAICAMSIKASAQEGPISISVRAGMNLSNMSIKNTDTDPRIGYQIGVLGDLNYNENLFFQSGLLFTTKGCKTKWSGRKDIDEDGYIDEGTIKENFNVNYLQLPLYAGYKVKVDENMKINFTAGPYLGFGMRARLKTEWAITDGSDGNLYVGSSDRNLLDGGAIAVFDCGLSGGVGIDINRILVNIGYEHGLVNINNGDRIANRNAFLTLGYRFK